MTDRTCATCRFATHLPRVMRDGAVDLSKPAEALCRRYPPQFIMLPNQGWVAAWPKVQLDCGCGEFGPKVSDA